MARRRGYTQMAVISGVGTRQYYRKFGYEIAPGLTLALTLALTSVPGQVDMLVQREGGPAQAVERLGCGVNSGFAFVRGQARGAEAAKFLLDAVQRGLVEFYNRWSNAGDLNPSPNPDH